MFWKKQPPGPRKCPVCSDKTLEPTTWHGLTVDVCPGCHGIWCDFGEMKLLEESDTLDHVDEAFEGKFTMQPLDTAMKAPERLCPVTAYPMERHEFGNGTRVVLDFCPDCGGTWLDAGELEGYTAYLQDQAAHPIHISDEEKAAIAEHVKQSEEELKQFMQEHNRRTMKLWVRYFRRKLPGI